MLLKKLLILVVFQIPDEPDSLAPKSYLKFHDWEDEQDVVSALKKLGHSVSLFGLKSDIQDFVQEISKTKPDLVFNLCDTFKNERKHEANITGVCELIGVPYTGASSFSLHLCQDKAIQKKILSYDEKIKTPKFLTIQKNTKNFNLSKLSFPAIVKPLNLEASEGICQQSYVTNQENCYKRIRFIQKKLNSDVIVEDYIDGSDVYVALIGGNNKKPMIGEPVKLIFSKYPPSKTTIATYKTKWDGEYRYKWGIRTTVMKKSKLTKKIQNLCQITYSKLKLSGYARFDMRIDKNNDCFFLEANPNPSIAKTDDFSKSVKACGINYLNIIEKIIFVSLHNKTY